MTINEFITALVKSNCSLTREELLYICCLQIERPSAPSTLDDYDPTYWEEEDCFELQWDAVYVNCFPWEQTEESSLELLFGSLLRSSRRRILEAMGLPPYLPHPWVPENEWEACATSQNRRRGSIRREVYQPQSRLVYNYSYSPTPNFFGVGPLFMGVELEVLASKEAALKIRGLDPSRSYLKSDSSIAGEGFEIVTHPLSLDEQTAYWKSVIRHVGSELSHNSSCGMHVHVSRAPLTQLQIGKILVFLNNPANDSWIDLVAGRSSNRYCQRKKKSIEDVGNQSSRYEALNLMNNETIEFRLFASSNKLEEILFRIEFCHAVVTWSEEAGLDQLEFSFFMEWLYSHTSTDSYLFLKEELVVWWQAGPPPKKPEYSSDDSYLDFESLPFPTWEDLEEEERTFSNPLEEDIDSLPW